MEACLKFARVAHLAKDKNSKRTRFIGFKGSFHGRSLGALSVTYKPAIREPFQEMINQNVDFCDFNDLEQTRSYMGTDVCAIVVEPIQGEGGVNPASMEFMQGLRELADEFGALLICDEIQCGIGRGKFELAGVVCILCVHWI